VESISISMHNLMAPVGNLSAGAEKPVKCASQRCRKGSLAAITTAPKPDRLRNHPANEDITPRTPMPSSQYHLGWRHTENVDCNDIAILPISAGTTTLAFAIESKALSRRSLRIRTVPLTKRHARRHRNIELETQPIGQTMTVTCTMTIQHVRRTSSRATRPTMTVIPVRVSPQPKTLRLRDSSLPTTAGHARHIDGTKSPLATS
jgi:hypothetical protein